jgi:hypothetical protein
MREFGVFRGVGHGRKICPHFKGNIDGALHVEIIDGDFTR